MVDEQRSWGPVTLLELTIVSDRKSWLQLTRKEHPFSDG